MENNYFEWAITYKVNLILTLIVVVLYFVLRRLVIPKLEDLIEKGSLKNDALRKAVTTFSLL